MARPERFELPTARFVAEYSIQLSYGREGGALSLHSQYIVNQNPAHAGFNFWRRERDYRLHPCSLPFGFAALIQICSRQICQTLGTLRVRASSPCTPSNTKPRKSGVCIWRRERQPNIKMYVFVNKGEYSDYRKRNTGHLPQPYHKTTPA